MFRSLIITGTAVFALALIAPQASADKWGLSISPGGVGFGYHDRDKNIHINTGPTYGYGYGNPYGYSQGYYQAVPVPQTYGQSYYYPRPYNPVVRRDVTQEGYYGPDGTFHSQSEVEDKHSSFYSPGRNEAITQPRTTTRQYYGPNGTWQTQEHTSWIGADGRPHSTTIDKTTSQDIWGNSHTDTNVTLKKAPAKTGANQSTTPLAEPAAPSTQAEQSQLNNKRGTGQN